MSEFADFLKDQLQDSDFRREYESLEAEYAAKQASIDKRTELGLVQKRISKAQQMLLDGNIISAVAEHTGLYEYRVGHIVRELIAEGAYSHARGAIAYMIEKNYPMDEIAAESGLTTDEIASLSTAPPGEPEITEIPWFDELRQQMQADEENRAIMRLLMKKDLDLCEITKEIGWPRHTLLEQIRRDNMIIRETAFELGVATGMAEIMIRDGKSIPEIMEETGLSAYELDRIKK